MLTLRPSQCCCLHFWRGSFACDEDLAFHELATPCDEPCRVRMLCGSRVRKLWCPCSQFGAPTRNSLRNGLSGLGFDRKMVSSAWCAKTAPAMTFGGSARRHEGHCARRRGEHSSVHAGREHRQCPDPPRRLNSNITVGQLCFRKIGLVICQSCYALILPKGILPPLVRRSCFDLPRLSEIAQNPVDVDPHLVGGTTQGVRRPTREACGRERESQIGARRSPLHGGADRGMPPDSQPDTPRQMGIGRLWSWRDAWYLTSIRHARAGGADPVNRLRRGHRFLGTRRWDMRVYTESGGHIGRSDRGRTQKGSRGLGGHGIPVRDDSLEESAAGCSATPKASRDGRSCVEAGRWN